MTHHDMDAEERDILDRFERGELRPAPDADREMEEARVAAHNTFKKTRRINLRVTERRLHARSRGRGKKGYPTRRWCRASSTSTCPDG